MYQARPVNFTGGLTFLLLICYSSVWLIDCLAKQYLTGICDRVDHVYCDFDKFLALHVLDL